jgi:hypothetical protein
LDKAGVMYRGMSAVEGATQVSYESPVAVLPTCDFQLFLAAKQVKSGLNDQQFIDEVNGISWDEYDWEDDVNIPEEFIFLTYRDLAIARAMKVQSYVGKLIGYLLKEEHKLSTDPEVVNLQKTAEEIKRNLGLYD